MNEMACDICLTQHEPGPCPVDELADLPPHVPPPTPTADEFRAFLSDLAERVNLIPDAPALDEAPPPSPCPVCDEPRSWKADQEAAEAGATVSAKAHCRACYRCEELPAGFRWAVFGRDLIGARVRLRNAVSSAEAAVRTRRVLLVGPAGAGKTSLLAAMFRARATAKPKERNAFVLAYRLGLCRQQHGLGDGEPPLVRRMLEAPIACIDDLGAESQTQTNAVPDVIFERHAQGAPLWVTTAMSKRDAFERYGERIVRRLAEAAKIINCGPLPTDWEVP